MGDAIGIVYRFVSPLCQFIELYGSVGVEIGDRCSKRGFLIAGKILAVPVLLLLEITLEVVAAVFQCCCMGVSDGFYFLFVFFRG